MLRRAFQELQSVLAWQLPITEHDVHPGLTQHRQGLLGMARFQHVLHAQLTEQGTRHPPHRLGLVHQQHMGGCE